VSSTVESSSPHLRRNVEEFDRRAIDPLDTEFQLQRRKVAKIAAIVASVAPKEHGADVGCHVGTASLEYRRAGIRSLVGFDVSEEALAVARSRGLDARFWNADGTPCPAPDRSFDLVIAGDVIEHLVDTDGFLAELRRILRPRGTLIITTPNLASWYSRFRVLRGLAPQGAPAASPTHTLDIFLERNHIRVNVAAEWRHLLQECGFEVLSIEGCAFWQSLGGGGPKAWLRGRLSLLAERRMTLADELILVARRL
jgi:2-polyprenyl-3-methyl-5-hydroxy-6-metoxy-1,4-benzoquinol methylase